MVEEILAGLSMMPHEEFRASTFPLFEEGLVDWLEWTFDMGWHDEGIPSWLDGLLQFYGNEGRLSGHGVQYSALSGAWTKEQDRWLENLQVEVETRKYAHISEHFGFARAGNYIFSAPLPVPLCTQAIETGQRNLERIKQIVDCPVGLENLALAFGLADVESQGYFLEKLIEPVDGFIVLDIHNIQCQSINFGIPVLDLIRSYPLERVLEIHISGGSYSTSKHGYANKPIRRDTHDGPVPPELYKLLPEVLKLCPNARVVILERLGNTFTDKKINREFANEFRQLKKVLKDVNRERATARGVNSSKNGKWNWVRSLPESKGETAAVLGELQSTLYSLLEDERNPEWVKSELKRREEFEVFSDYIDSVELRMLEVGQELIRKWGVKRD